MKITLFGAAGGEVTGSCYLLQTAGANVMIDCGLFQGSSKTENRNRIPTAARLKQLDAVVLTHAHLDHTGRLPLLAKQGYRGPVHCTAPTVDLANLVLQDSARLQLSDCVRENRKRARQGQEPIEPLYRTPDVDALRPLFRTFDHDEPTEVAKGISVRAVDAGHMLGSASLEVTVAEKGRKRVVVFSGDIGPRGAPIHRDPTLLGRADILFLESTYGNRDHRSLKETVVETREAIREAIERKAKILVPAFAIGRTQILLYLLAGAFQRKTPPPIPIYVDSPMGIEATKIYKKHALLFDEEAKAMGESGELSANLRTLKNSPCAAPLTDRLGRVSSPGARCRYGHTRIHFAPRRRSDGRAREMSVSGVGGSPYPRDAAAAEEAAAEAPPPASRSAAAAPGPPVASPRPGRLARPGMVGRPPGLDGVGPASPVRAATAATASAPAGRPRFSRSVLKDVMREHGIRDEVALLRKAVALDDGNRYLNRAELEAAARALTLPGLAAGVPADWRAKIRPALASESFRELDAFVARERRTGGVYPPADLVWNALRKTRFEDVKVVLVGQDPYHGEGEAMGLSFSLPRGVRVPSSLRNIYRELEDDVGATAPAHGDLTAWAERGVLLLNTALTVRADEPGSHRGRGWEAVTDTILREVGKRDERVVFVLLGADAQRKAALIDTSKHTIVTAAHPSGLSANRGFFGSRPFSRVNEALVDARRAPIDWQLPR